MRNFDEFQRLLRLTYVVMNCASDFESSSTPQKSFSLDLPAARLKPVPTGSIKTRSLLSSRQFSLSVTEYGAGAVGSALAVTTRRGPKAPMCSQIDEDPGPPLYTKAIGRWLGSLTSLRA